MKNLKELSIILGAMALSVNDRNYSRHKSYKELTQDEKDEIKIMVKRNRLELLKKRGVQEFQYGEHTIIARNKKNADRKAKNKGYLNLNQ